MQKTDFGIIGLAVMGRSLALNMADHGFKVGGYNRSRMVTEDLVKEHPHENFIPFYELEELVSSQERPRKFLIMVKAGRPVDLVIDQLVPLLDEGDMILDGGNSFFEDTIRREKSLKEKGIYYFGTGVSAEKRGQIWSVYYARRRQRGLRPCCACSGSHCGKGPGRAMLCLYGTGRSRTLCENGA